MSSNSEQGWTVVNATFTTSYGQYLPSLEVLKTLCGFAYERSKHNAAIVRFDGVRGTIQLFQSGAAVIIGVRNETEALSIAQRLLQELLDIDLTVQLGAIVLRNYVVSTKLEDYFVSNLWSILGRGGRSIVDACSYASIGFVYEPELFPSVKLYLPLPTKSTVCIFRKGCVIITGLTNTRYVDDIICKVKGILTCT